MRILVAGVGNLLQGDDGFGVEVAHRLQSLTLPPEVKVVETGTGGIHLVQEILGGFDALIMVDAVDRGRPPGTVMVIEPEIDSSNEMTMMERFDYLADMHYTKPSKALMLARELKILPPRTFLVGCQPLVMDQLIQELSPEVAGAVDVAIDEILSLIDGLVVQGASG
jgi:hydrogenase maturation protease